MVSLSMSFSAFNEEKNLPKLIKDAVSAGKRFADKYEVVVVVYEGSKDRSIDVVKNIAKKNKNVRLVLQKKDDRGIGVAYRLGLINSRYDYLFYSDADNQFDLNDIGRLMQYLPEYDLVAGYRLDRKDAFGRKFASKIYNIIVRIFFGKTVKDLDCAFRLMKKDVIRNIDLRCRGGTLTAEMVIKARQKGYKIKDVAVNHLPRLAGSSVFESKIPFPKPKTVLMQLSELKKVWEDIHS